MAKDKPKKGSKPRDPAAGREARKKREEVIHKPKPKPDQRGGGGESKPEAGRKKSRKELAAERMASKKGGPGSPGYERRLRAWMKEYGVSEGGGRGGRRGGGGGAAGEAAPVSGWEDFPFPTTPPAPPTPPTPPTVPPTRPERHPPRPQSEPLPPGVPPREYPSPLPNQTPPRPPFPQPPRPPYPHPRPDRDIPQPGELPEQGAPPSPPSLPTDVTNPYTASYPSWWRSVRPRSIDENTQYQAIANMMLPFLSPEDQRTMATNLYAINPKDFAHLDPTKIAWGGAPANEYGELSGQAKSDFTSKGRAQAAMRALEALRGAMGKKEEELGPGYAFIKSLLGTLGSFGGSQAPTGGGGMAGMTRAQARAMLGALDPLMTMAKSDELGAYGPLAQALATPFFSSGELLPFSRTEEGGYTFGKRNKRLFF